MSRGKARLEAEFVTKGAGKAADDAKQVDKSLKGIGKTTDEGVKSTEKATEAQRKINASTEDYTSLLSRIHPALGAMSDALVKGGRVMGNFASQQIHLGSVLRKTRGAIVANAKALKLLGAVGLVIAGIAAIAKAIRTMREEFERATSAIKAHQQALNELEGKRQERSKAMEGLTDAQRRDPVAIADEIRQLTTTAERIGKKFPDLDAGAVNRAVAGSRGTGMDFDQVSDLAIIEGRMGGARMEPGLPARVRGNRAYAALRRNASRLAGFKERERQQLLEAAQAAVGQTTGEGRSLELERVIAEHAPAGADPAKIARLRKQFPTMGDLEDYEGGGTVNVFGSKQRIAPLRRPGAPISLTPGGAAERYGSDEERATWRAVLAAFQSIDQKMGNGQQPTVHHHNGRYTYPDANTMRRNTVNGETMRNAWEGN